MSTRKQLIRVPPSVERVGRAVVDAGIYVHGSFGPGLLESVYEEALATELQHRGVAVARQVAVPLRHRGTVMSGLLRLDLVVERCVIVEVKAVQALADVHTAQLLTYLRLSGIHLGFLMNFNTPLLKEGLRRVVA